MLFSDLPTELIQQILHYLPPHSFLAISRTTKHLRTVADTPLLWRHFCRTQYAHWDPRHHFHANLDLPVDATPWKTRYIARRVLDRHVGLLIDDMVNKTRGRIEKMEAIVNIDTLSLEGGNRDLWDVKDALLRHIRCDEDAEDVLARRFWAQATLDKLHRSRAVSMWSIAKEEVNTYPLERLLGAFDLFVDGVSDAECADVSELLDAVAESFKRENPEHEEWRPKDRAVKLALYLRSNGFRGAQDVFYHNLPNNFIVRALRDPEHPALPIICVAIYCGVARRIGVPASPCGFPMHVYAVVDACIRDSEDPIADAQYDPANRIYIDAFRPEVEVPLGHLSAQLSSMGASPPSADAYLGPASPTEICIRTSRNILHSVRMTQQRPVTRGERTDTAGWPDAETALYAALWVSILLHDTSGDGASIQDRHRMRHHLPFLCEIFQSHFPWDAALFEDHVLPQLLGFPEYAQLVQMLRMVRAGDANARPVVRREAGRAELVRFKVGQVFEHRRFRYQGVVIGWDVQCDASEEWVEQMGVENLERGREQSFYHILAEDKSNRYVAEDNIVLSEETPSPALMRLAGRYFRRWDAEEGVFVSNIRDEYPDD